MGIRTKKTESEAEGRKAVSRRAASQKEASAAPSKAQKESAQQREKAAKEKALSMLAPGVADWFRENLGFDLESPKVRASELYDLMQGKLLSENHEFVVTPLAYDREKKENVEMPRIKTVARLRAVLPFEKGKPVRPDDDHRIFVQTVPCRPYIEKAEGAELSREAAPSSSERESPSFSDVQVMALEGVGINRERLYGGFNHLSREEKCDIAEGRVFPVDGMVKTSFGYLNVIGEAQLSTAKDGTAKAVFMPTYPEQRSADRVIDLLAARTIGMLELDVFRRDGNNRVISDVNGVPLLNDEGRNIVTYGTAMGPVTGYLHKREYDAKAKKFVDKIDRGHYQVTAVNGCLYATPMKEVPVLRPDGTKDTYRDEKGKEVVRTRPEIAQARVSDGKVFVDGRSEPLAFKTERDMADFLQGKGGVVVGAAYHDFKANKDVTYDAFVVPDNTRGGFAHAFTPQTTEAILRERDRKVRSTKKQNFGIGF